MTVLVEKEATVDLLHAALLVAKLDNEELDVAAYRMEVERMAREIDQSLPAAAGESARLTTLTGYLFAENGFHGSRTDYYNPSNSYLNEVIDDREGLPITLSVLFMEIGRRLGLNIVGVGMPGHFVVRHIPANGEGQLIDVFNGGKPIPRGDAARIVRSITGSPLRDEHLETTDKRAIIVRMLRNLLGIADATTVDSDRVIRYLDTILAISTGSGTRAPNARFSTSTSPLNIQICTK